jgi:hypothetical protein
MGPDDFFLTGFRVQHKRFPNPSFEPYSRPIQFLLCLRMTIRTQEVALCCLSDKHLMRAIRAIPSIKGKRFGGRIAMMEREGT